MRCFVIVIQEDASLDFRLMKREGALLRDKKREQAFLIEADAYPTNWRGKLQRAYLVQEQAPETIDVAGASVTIDGRARRVEQHAEPEPTPSASRGVTAETIYERTLSAQMRRLGNRRVSATRMAGLAGVGVFFSLIAIAIITVNGGGPQPIDANESVPIVITPGTQPAEPDYPTSGPTEVIVGPTEPRRVPSHTPQDP